jgi:hypothetical protein
MKKITFALLSTDYSPEREVPLNSGHHVYDALDRETYIDGVKQLYAYF